LSLFIGTETWCQASREGRPQAAGGYPTVTPNLIPYFVLQSPQLLKLELISRLGSAGLDHANRQFQHRMRRQTRRQSPWNHLFADLADSFLSIQVHHVDRELHSKAVHCFTRCNPQSCARLELGVLQQAGPPLRASVGDIRSLGQNCTSVLVPHLYLQDLGYNTILLLVLRRLRRLFPEPGVLG
jgi:hypothetical protein